jgi:tungstate transport system permease protein
MEFMYEGIKEAFWLLFNMDEETISAISVTIKTSTISIFFSILIGFPLAFFARFF